MKKMKKVLAMLLAMVMVLGMSVTVSANQVEKGVASKDDTATVSIEGISGGATVTLYQIAKGVYGDSGKGLIKYEYVEGIDELSEQPTSGEINEIHRSILNGANVLEADRQTGITGTYKSKELNSGAYLAIISEATDGSIYNPVLLTVSYNAQGMLESGNVNITDGYIYGSSAVAKKTTPNVDKEIVDGTTSDGDKETASVGDVITYQITPTMPSYPENAKNKTFFFADTMSEGLTFVFESLKINFKEDTTKAITVTKNNDGTLSFTTEREGESIEIAKATEGKNGFYLNFSYDALLYNTNTTVEDDVDSMMLQTEQHIYTPIIKYQAVLNDKAIVGGDGNPNDARMYYSHEPNTGETFVPGPNTPEPNGSTPGVSKKEDKEIVYTYQLAFLKTGEGNDAEKLADAVFGIYSDANCENLIDVVKTNKEGYAVSSKVGAGTYYIKELVAPTGYTLNDKIYSIKAEWKTATSTITTSNREWKYTTNISEAKNETQIGWIDTKNTESTSDDVFYALDEYNGAAVDDDVDNMGIENMPDGISLLPAYVVYDKTKVETSEITTSNPGAGTAATLIDPDGEEADSIPNTKLSALPSTGGIGTTIFTIGGCAIMIIAAGLYFATRRKSAK